MEPIEVSQIKSGRYFRLIPYKSIYMVVTDEHAGCVQYHIINCEHGVVTATFPNVPLVVDFLNKWKAKPTKAMIVPLLDPESEPQ
jgi:hypothetical protein